MLALHPAAAPSPLRFTPSAPERRLHQRAAADRSAAHFGWIRSITAGPANRPTGPDEPAHPAAGRVTPQLVSRSVVSGPTGPTTSPATAIGLPWPLPGIHGRGERRRPDAPANPAGDGKDGRRPLPPTAARAGQGAAPERATATAAPAARAHELSWLAISHRHDVSTHSLPAVVMPFNEANWIDPLEVMAVSDAADLALLKSVMLMTAATMLLALTARVLA